VARMASSSASAIVCGVAREVGRRIVAKKKIGDRGLSIRTPTLGQHFLFLPTPMRMHSRCRISQTTTRLCARYVLDSTDTHTQNITGA
jgi:hypothetical protein